MDGSGLTWTWNRYIEKLYEDSYVFLDNQFKMYHSNNQQCLALGYWSKQTTEFRDTDNFNSFSQVFQQYRSGFFESDTPAKTLGCDVILNAVRKQRGYITKLVRGGCYLGVNEGKERGKKRNMQDDQNEENTQFIQSVNK